MEIQTAFGPKELLAHIVGDIANAVSERAGESPQRRLERHETAANTIMTFQPLDAIEAMLAGHCVMFHEMIVDSVNDTLRGEEAAARRGTRSNIAAMDKAFGNNLVRLEQYRNRHAHGIAEAHPAEARAEPEIEDRVHRHQSATAPQRQAHSDQSPGAGAGRTIQSARSDQSPGAGGTILRYPSAEVIADSPDAVDDSEPVARARGASQSSADSLSPTGTGTWAPSPPTHQSTIVGGNRHQRRHPNP